MKASRKTVEDIADKLIAVCSFAEITLDQIDTDSKLRNVWMFIYREVAYSDDHPRFNEIKRLFPYDHSYALYPDGTNDSTMLTALKAALATAKKKIKKEKA